MAEKKTGKPSAPDVKQTSVTLKKAVEALNEDLKLGKDVYAVGTEGETADVKAVRLKPQKEAKKPAKAAKAPTTPALPPDPEVKKAPAKAVKPAAVKPVPKPIEKQAKPAVKPAAEKGLAVKEHTEIAAAGGHEIAPKASAVPARTDGHKDLAAKEPSALLKKDEPKAVTPAVKPPAPAPVKPAPVPEKPTEKPAKPATEKQAKPGRPRLLELYESKCVPELIKRFKYKNVNQVPKLEKVVLNMGLGDVKDNAKSVQLALEELKTISGQKPVATKAKKAVSNFKVRAGMAIGAKVTLRGRRMYEFTDKLLNIALPRVRDFRGTSPKSFDGRGNYAMGVKEQLIFPEISYDQIEKIRGFDICFVTTAKTDEEAKVLLTVLGMPFKA